MADLPLLQMFSDRVNRPNSTTFQSDFFSWQYFQNALLTQTNSVDGLSRVYAAFSEGGAVLGYCTGCEVRLWGNGRDLKGVWLHEWFVDPSASGIGFQLLDAVVRNSEFVAVSGASVYTMNVFLRLAQSVSWFELERLVAVFDETASLALLKGAHLNSHAILKKLKPRSMPVTDIDIKPLNRFGDETDRAWHDMRTHVTLGTSRDASSMNHRYVNHPRFVYSRALFRSASGLAVMVWRVESVVGVSEAIKVGRLCEVVGSPRAITAAMPAFLKIVAEEGVALCDFFCSHAETLDAMMIGGMYPVVNTPYLDLARLFSPLHFEMRRTISMACFVRAPKDMPQFQSVHRFLFTKGDGNQDRPNP